MADGMMRYQLHQFPLEGKHAIIPVLCGLGYWVMRESNIGPYFPFTVHWNNTEKSNSACRRDYYDFFTRGGTLHRPAE